MNFLSRNVLCEIFAFLTPTDIIIISSTCKHLQKAAESDIVWVNSPDLGNGFQRKAIFARRGRITRNIFTKVKQVLQLSGHSRTINCVRVEQNEILTCSDDNSVRLWNTENSRANKIIEHTDRVIKTGFWDEGVVSVGADRTLRVWKREDQKVKVEYAHAAGITQMKKVDGGKILTGGYDGVVKLWDLSRVKALATYQDFDRDISILDTCQQYFCYASSLNTGICLRNFERPDVLQKIEL